MLTHIKQPGESSPPFEPSQHIGEAAAMVVVVAAEAAAVTELIGLL